jgi:hypothetical protein
MDDIIYKAYLHDKFLFELSYIPDVGDLIRDDDTRLFYIVTSVDDIDKRCNLRSN